MRLHEITHLTLSDKSGMFDWLKNIWFRTQAVQKLSGKINEFPIYIKTPKPDLIYLGLLDTETNKFIGFLLIEETDNGFWKTANVGFDPQYHGKGLPIKLYEFVIKKLNLVLRSDSLQSTGGKSIWKKLDKIPTIFVYAYNPLSKRAFNIDPETLSSPKLAVYNTDIEDEKGQLHNKIIEIANYISNLKDQITISAEDKEKIQFFKKEIRDIRDELNRLKELGPGIKPYLIATAKKNIK